MSQRDADGEAERVADLESKVQELEATVRGLTEELVDAKERVRLLEAETPEEATDEDGDTLVIADHGSDDNDPEPAPDGATEVDAADEATKSEGGEESSQEGEASDDIIVA